MADEIEEATLEEFIAEPERKKPRLILIAAAAGAVALIAAVAGSILMLGREPAADAGHAETTEEFGDRVLTADENAREAAALARAAAEGDMPSPEPVPEPAAPAAAAAPATQPAASPLPPAAPAAH